MKVIKRDGKSVDYDKEKIFLVMAEINKLSVDLPIKMNQVLIKNVLSLGVDIIATKECN